MENAYASDPGLWRKNFTDCYEQKHTRVITLNDITEQTFPAYCRLLEENGFVVQEARGRYAAYQKEGMGVFLNDWGSSLRIVLEENCNYFSFQSPAARADLSPQITQIHLEDFGMSYAIRLSDGRFILIDGGRDFPPDADELFRCLKEGSLHSVPIIAAWIMSHPHSDHVPCFGTFMERYGAQVIIEKILYNFPQAAKFVPPDKPKEEKTLSENVDKDTVEPFEALVKELGIPVYTPHTGQIYLIGDALCEILSSLDDTIHCATNINATSLVIRMELGGQVILWATDASFSHAHPAERYGTYLKPIFCKCRITALARVPMRRRSNALISSVPPPVCCPYPSTTPTTFSAPIVRVQTT